MSLTRNALLENGAKTPCIFDLIFFILISWKQLWNMMSCREKRNRRHFAKLAIMLNVKYKNIVYFSTPLSSNLSHTRIKCWWGYNVAYVCVRAKHKTSSFLSLILYFWCWELFSINVNEMRDATGNNYDYRCHRYMFLFDILLALVNWLRDSSFITTF